MRHCTNRQPGKRGRLLQMPSTDAALRKRKRNRSCPNAGEARRDDCDRADARHARAQRLLTFRARILPHRRHAAENARFSLRCSIAAPTVKSRNAWAMAMNM